MNIKRLSIETACLYIPQYIVTTVMTYINPEICMNLVECVVKYETLEE